MRSSEITHHGKVNPDNLALTVEKRTAGASRGCLRIVYDLVGQGRSYSCCSEPEVLQTLVRVPLCRGYLATGNCSPARQSTVMDAGRIINPLAGRNQIQGAVVMAIGMALFEETIYDPQNGAPINSNLADYMVTVRADAPPIDVFFLDYPDKEINELGARGIGEIGLAGIAAAITDALHHATGVRVRELPVKIENLLV